MSLLAEDFRLVHAPGIAVNRAGQGFAGGGRKSDPRDARTTADLVRTRDPRPIVPDDKTVTAIRLKIGRCRDLIEEQTRRLNRLRGLLSSIHPELDRDLAAELIACVGDIRRFPSVDALASAAGLAPVIRQSGRKTGWRRTCGGDKAPKCIFYQGAFCAVCQEDPLSKGFYD